MDLEERVPGCVPVRWFCRVTEEEVEEALLAACRAKGQKKPPKRSYLEKVLCEMDALLRNPTFDPFIVRGRCSSRV